VNIERTVVRLGEIMVRRPPALLITVGLGSCVAVLLRDANTGVGGLAHVLLPSPGPGKAPEPEGRYGSSAVPALVREMRALGAEPAGLSARLVGGASMFAALAGQGVLQIGERNIEAVRQALAGAGVAITGAATGGDYGRSVEFNLATGEVRVTSYAHDPEYL
jgi:chemotaxis protein CheD